MERAGLGDAEFAGGRETYAVHIGIFGYWRCCHVFGEDMTSVRVAESGGVELRRAEEVVALEVVPGNGWAFDAFVIAGVGARYVVGLCRHRLAIGIEPGGWGWSELLDRPVV